MRLIDADALENELGIDDRDIYVKYTLEDAHTIEAIPVEWMQAQVKNEKRAPLFRRYADALLTIWQMEQEAQNG